MTPYAHFSTDAFIQDEYFQQWVFSPDEASDVFWKEFLEVHPAQRKAVTEARQFLLLFDQAEQDVLASRVTHLKRRIDAAIDNSKFIPEQELLASGHVSMSPRRNSWVTYAAAASVALLMVSGYLLYRYAGVMEQVGLTRPGVAVTQKGQRSLITLSDGTQVWLNADSRLSYPASFAGEKNREVYLEGEAFFDVAENKAQPFIVGTADLQVQVLGTAFNVRSYGKDQMVETTLVRGRVNIESKGEDPHRVTLSPNQKAVFEKASRRLMLQNQVDTETYTAWREGKLIFDDEPMSEIRTALERWYNVTVYVQDTSALSCRFSAKIDNKPLEEVMELFKASENIDYRIEGDSVKIFGKLCTE